MTPQKYRWSWWVGTDEEWLTTECESREEAVEIARTEYEGAHICEALEPVRLRLADWFDAFEFIESAEDRAEEYQSEYHETVFEVSREQATDLEKMVRETIQEWQTKHNLVFKSAYFQQTRNPDYIEMEEEV